MSYDVVAYGAMIADRGRTDAFTRAIESRIAPGAVVADIGTGSGLFAMIACRAGAARVYAIEADDIIQVAREAAAANGFGDRIRFIQASSTEIDLPEPVDGIISDLRGALPFFGRGVEAIIDARDRWLKRSTGWLIGEQDVVWASLVSSARLHAQYVTNWDCALGIDMGPARERSCNRYGGVALEPHELRAPAQQWASIDYATVTSPTGHRTLTWTIESAITLHGIGAWFDTQTAPGIGFSNAPWCESHVYRQVFFPWPDAVACDKGDEVRALLRADLVNGDYVFSWHTEIIDGRSGRPVLSFRQSTFNGAPWSRDTLHRRANTYTPVPGDWAAVDRRVLELMDGRRSIDELADEILAAFPQLIKSRTEALTRVGNLSVRYARRSTS